ncbi:MAG: hypothetical protein MUF14_04040 [Hyphomonadaceae bacterium]|nr:hypothetical protein [Hyphomonadaceae bacterium]
MIHAIEEVLRIERGKTVRLTRTRQKVAKVGEIQTLIDFATAASPTEGFDALLARGLPELTAEALVLKHAARFEPPVLAAAGARLAAAGVTLPSMQSEPA